MKKLIVLAALALVTAAAPAQADKPGKPAKQEHTTAIAHTPKTHPAPAKCLPNTEGFHASGTLVSSMLTRQADGGYSGTLVVTVKKANHHAPTQMQTYTLTDARVSFRHGVDATAPAAGSRVSLSGKITQLPNKHCSTTGFTPTVTVKHVTIKAAKHA